MRQGPHTRRPFAGGRLHTPADHRHNARRGQGGSASMHTPAKVLVMGQLEGHSLWAETTGSLAVPPGPLLCCPSPARPAVPCFFRCAGGDLSQGSSPCDTDPRVNGLECQPPELRPETVPPARSKHSQGHTCVFCSVSWRPSLVSTDGGRPVAVCVSSICCVCLTQLRCPHRGRKAA